MKQSHIFATSLFIIFFLFIAFFVAAPRLSFMHVYMHSNMGSMNGMDSHMDEMQSHMSTDEKRETFISLKNSIQDDLRPQVKYRCCLENPCMTCIEKTPGHGEGASCDCMKDIMEGRHPCGECIGGILEGHGNPYLAEYFATAIAEKVGEEHLPTLRKIISEKYSIAVEKQV